MAGNEEPRQEPDCTPSALPAARAVAIYVSTISRWTAPPVLGPMHRPLGSRLLPDSLYHQANWMDPSITSAHGPRPQRRWKTHQRGNRSRSAAPSQRTVVEPRQLPTHTNRRGTAHPPPGTSLRPGLCNTADPSRPASDRRHIQTTTIAHDIPEYIIRYSPGGASTTIYCWPPCRATTYSYTSWACSSGGSARRLGDPQHDSNAVESCWPRRVFLCYVSCVKYAIVVNTFSADEANRAPQ